MSIPGQRISETALRERQLAHARVQTFPNLRYQRRYRNLGCLEEISRFLIRLEKNYTERKKKNNPLRTFERNNRRLWNTRKDSFVAHLKYILDISKRNMSFTVRHVSAAVRPLREAAPNEVGETLHRRRALACPEQRPAV